MQCGKPGFKAWVQKIPWRRAGQPTPVFLPRESPWTEEPGRLQFSQFSSVAQSCLTLRHHGLQHGRLPCPSPILGACSNSCPSSWWCPRTILSSVFPVSSCFQSFPASGSFPTNQLFTWGGQSIGVSASASFLPMNIKEWFPLGWTGWISLQSEGFSRVFSNTTVQKHQFFSTQPYLWSNSHIYWKNHGFD